MTRPGSAGPASSERTPSVRLGPGAEFDAIRRFLRDEEALPRGVRVGPGDDAAVLEGGWVVSTDLCVEDVHYRRSWLSDTEIGYRAASAALSDLAAMAAEPVGVLVSLALPAEARSDPVAVSDGVREAARAVGASILGGDLSRSPGPLMLDLVVLGRADEPVLRVGAEPGDEIWATGTLGGSAAAVRMWAAGHEPPEGLHRPGGRADPRRSRRGGPVEPRGGVGARAPWG